MAKAGGDTTKAINDLASTYGTTSANMTDILGSQLGAGFAGVSSGLGTLGQQIGAGTEATTGAIGQLGTTLGQQIGAGTEATKTGLADLGTAVNNVGNLVQSTGASTTAAIDQISKQMGIDTATLSKAVADSGAATTAALGTGLGNLGTQIGTGLGTLGTQLGAGFGGINAALAAQTAAQRASAATGQRTAAQSFMQQGTDATGGIKNLTPGLTKANQDYTLAGIPNIQETMNPLQNMATGGGVDSYDPFVTGSSGDSVSSGLSGSLKPGLTKAQIQYILTGLPGNLIEHKAGGGLIEDHNPQFFSEGGLGSIENRYVQGEGDGTSDSVPAMLANGEFVIPADVVSKLGNGSNESGAGVLDQFLKSIRSHAQSNGEKLPPDSKGPLAYLLDAKRKVKA